MVPAGKSHKFLLYLDAVEVSKHSVHPSMRRRCPEFLCGWLLRQPVHLSEEESKDKINWQPHDKLHATKCDKTCWEFAIIISCWEPTKTQISSHDFIIYTLRTANCELRLKITNDVSFKNCYLCFACVSASASSNSWLDCNHNRIVIIPSPNRRT